MTTKSVIKQNTNTFTSGPGSKAGQLPLWLKGKLWV